MPSIDQFAVILYTLRDHLKTREDVVSTLKRVAEIGYRQVQISGMDTELMPATEIKTVCDDLGLGIAGTHENPAKILKEPEWVIDRLKALETDFTAYPYPAEIDLSDAEAVMDLSRALDAAGAKLRAAGLDLLYHNHAMELYKLDGKTVLERIYATTDADNLKAELDVHWLQRGGANPLEWIEAMAGRMPAIHLKDFAATPANEIRFAELGEGNLDLPAIVKAAENGGCRTFIVEQDTCPGDPFDSIEISFNYIKSALAK